MDYAVDGRDAAMASLRKWLKTNWPAPDKATTISFASKKEVARLLKEKAEAYNERARVAFTWRAEFAERLKIKDGDIVLAINTIVEEMERELANGGTVRIFNFGDIKLRKHKWMGEFRNIATFQADENWKRELNAPLYKNEIGLKYKSQRRNLIRDTEVSEESDSVSEQIV